MFQIFEMQIERLCYILSNIFWISENYEMILRCLNGAENVLTALEWEQEKPGGKNHVKLSDLKNKTELHFVGNLKVDAPCFTGGIDYRKQEEKYG